MNKKIIAGMMCLMVFCNLCSACSKDTTSESESSAETTGSSTTEQTTQTTQTTGCNDDDDEDDSIKKLTYDSGRNRTAFDEADWKSLSDVGEYDQKLQRNSGRIYCDSRYYKTVDGKSYIAVNLVSSQTGDPQGPFFYTMTDKEAQALKDGDKLKIDRDLEIEIKDIDRNPDWEDPSMSHSPPDMKMSRPSGMIILDSQYALIHPGTTIYTDGHVEFECQVPDTDWILVKADNKVYLQMGFLNTYEPCNLCLWVPVSDNVKAQFFRKMPDGSYASISVSVYDILNALKEYGYDRSYYNVYFEMEKNEIVSIEVELL